MQPVKSLETIALMRMAKDPLGYLNKLSDDFAAKLCDASDPEIVLPFLAKTERDLKISEKLKLLLVLHKDVQARKTDYDSMDEASRELSSSPPLHKVIACNEKVARIQDFSLERLRKYNEIMSELKEGYLE